MSPISPQVVVDAFIAKINAHDAREVIACCTSDHVFIDSLGMHHGGVACAGIRATHRRVANLRGQ